MEERTFTKVFLVPDEEALAALNSRSLSGVKSSGAVSGRLTAMEGSVHFTSRQLNETFRDISQVSLVHWSDDALVPIALRLTGTGPGPGPLIADARAGGDHKQRLLDIAGAIQEAIPDVAVGPELDLIEARKESRARPPTTRDYYRILGVSTDAGLADAFAARDRVRSSSEWNRMEESMDAIRASRDKRRPVEEAWIVLGDDELRSKYREAVTTDKLESFFNRYDVVGWFDLAFTMADSKSAKSGIVAELVRRGSPHRIAERVAGSAKAEHVGGRTRGVLNLVGGAVLLLGGGFLVARFLFLDVPAAPIAGLGALIALSGLVTMLRGLYQTITGK